MAEQPLTIIDKNWITIYPAYINSNRSLQQGRLVSKDKAVPDPRWQEIKDVLETIKGLQVKEENNKVYPREPDKELPAFRGRIRYLLPPNDPRFKRRDDVLLYLCEMIPKLKTRLNKGSSNQVQNTDPGANQGKKKKSRKN